MTLTFTTYPLKLGVGNPDTFTLADTASPLTCTGGLTGTLDVTGGGQLFLVGTCVGGVMLNGSGTATPPGRSAINVNITAAGPSVSQAWTFSAISGVTTFQAAGAFTWLNTNEITNCAGAGTSTMTLTGALVVEVP